MSHLNSGFAGNPSRARWVQHSRMLADALTKRNSNAVTLLKVVRDAVYRIFDELDDLEARCREGAAWLCGQTAPSRAVVDRPPGRRLRAHISIAYISIAYALRVSDRRLVGGVRKHAATHGDFLPVRGA